MTISTTASFLAAACTLAAAALHFACLAWGADGYRFLGAGDAVASAVEAGDWRPHLSAVLVGTALLVGTWYALAGAGAVARPPFLKAGLLLIAAVFLARAALFPLLRPLFPGNGPTFWLVSSGACAVIGLLFLAGAFGDAAASVE